MQISAPTAYAPNPSKPTAPRRAIGCVPLPNAAFPGPHISFPIIHRTSVEEAVERTSQLVRPLLLHPHPPSLTPPSPAAPFVPGRVP